MRKSIYNVSFRPLNFPIVSPATMTFNHPQLFDYPTKLQCVSVTYYFTQTKIYLRFSLNYANRNIDILHEVYFCDCVCSDVMYSGEYNVFDVRPTLGVYPHRAG